MGECKAKQVVEKISAYLKNKNQGKQISAWLSMNKDSEVNSRLPNRKVEGKNINHTGGAYGADSIWAKLLRPFGVVNNHYRPTIDGKIKRLGELTKAGDNVINITVEEEEKGNYLNALLGNSTHPLNNRNYVQIRNADKVFAVAPLNPVTGWVDGGTGSAVRMANYLGKKVYVLNTNDVKWYEYDGRSYKEMKEYPDMSGNIAAVGTRKIEAYNTPQGGSETLPTATPVLEQMQNTVNATFNNGDKKVKHYNVKPITPINNKTGVIVDTKDKVTRSDIKASPDKIYIFGDNMKREGLGGQAKAMRGEPNTLGIRTKNLPDNSTDAYFNDDNIEYKQALIEDLNQLQKLIDEGKTIVLPKKGIGTGLAKLEEKAPNLYNVLATRLNQMVGYEYMKPYQNNEQEKDTSDKRGSDEYADMNDGKFNTDLYFKLRNEKRRRTEQSIVDKNLVITKTYSDNFNTMRVTDASINDDTNTVTLTFDGELDGVRNPMITFDMTTGKNHNGYEIDDWKEIYYSDRVKEPGTDVNDIIQIDEEFDIGKAQELQYLFEDLYGYDLEHNHEKLTPEFAQFQLHVIQQYSEMGKILNKDNIDLKIFENELLETSGLADVANGKVAIRVNPMSRMASSSEMLIHETTHVMVAEVLKDRPDLRNILEDLRTSVLATGIDYNVFLKGVENPTSKEIAIAKRKFDYVFDPSADIEEFYSYAVSNQKVYNAIKDIRINTKLVKEFEGTGKVDKILNKFVKIINTVWITLTKGGKGSQILARMVNQLAQGAYELENRKTIEYAKKDKGLFDTSSQIIQDLDDKLSEILQRKEEQLIELSKKGNKPFSKLTARLNKIPLIHAAIETGVVQYVWNTVMTDTTRKGVAEMYRVFRQSKSFVEKHTSDIRNAVKQLVKKNFENASEREKEAVKRIVVDIDVGILTTDVNELKAYIEDNNKLDDKIKSLETEVAMAVTKDSLDDVMKQINGLAEYITTGNSIIHNQQINAHNIVHNLKATSNGVSYATSVIDQLVTAKALAKVKDTDGKNILTQIEHNKEVLEDSIRMHRNYISELIQDSTAGAYNPVPKGYSKAEEGTIKYRLIPEHEVEAQIAVNMRLVGDSYEYNNWKPNKVKASDRLKNIKPTVLVDGVKYYMMTGRVKTLGYSEGAIGLIGTTMEGITLSSLIRKNLEEETDPWVVNKAVKRAVETYNDKPDKITNVLLVTKNKPIPVYNSAGELVDYRFQMNKAEKDMELDDDTSLEEVMSNTYSRSTKTQLTKEFNKRVIDTIIRDSADNFDKNPDDYVLIEEYTEEMADDGVRYEKRFDRWKNLPEHTKAYIHERLGTNGIVINKKYVELMMGEKDITFGNFKLGSFDMNKHPKAKARIMALESYIKELLGYMKRTLVLLDVAVVIPNILSNAAVAWVHGIDPIDYVKAMTKKWVLLNEFDKLNRAKADLEVQLRTGKDVQSKIDSLNARIEKHAMYSLSKDGQYTPIADDINVEAKPNGQLYQAMDKAIGNGRLGDMVRGAMNILYVNRGSRLGKLALKNTQRQDVMTRAVILDEMIKKKVKKLGRGLTEEEHQELLDYVDQMLVNYGYTMNRYWNFADKVLGILFLRYYFAQAKAVTAMTIKNPMRVLGLEMGQVGTGIDIAEPFETYTRSLYDSIMNRFMLGDTPGEILKPNIANMFGL